MSQSQLTTAASPARVASRPQGYAATAPLAPLRVVPAAIRRTGNGVFAVICMTCSRPASSPC